MSLNEKESKTENGFVDFSQSKLNQKSEDILETDNSLKSEKYIMSPLNKNYLFHNNLQSDRNNHPKKPEEDFSVSIDKQVKELSSQDEKMFEKVLNDWLTEYKSLPESAIDKYAENIQKQDEPLKAFEKAIFGNGKSLLSQYITPACHQLFKFYRSKNKKMKLYAIGFFPALIGGFYHNHLSLNSNSNENYSSLCTIILSIYGLLCDESNQNSSMNLSQHNSTTQVPCLSKSSIYHNATLYPYMENLLDAQRRQTDYIIVSSAKQYSKITASNRAKIFGILMKTYFEWITELQPASLSLLCRVGHYLSTRGYPWQKLYLEGLSHDNFRRIPLEAHLFLPILQSVYYAIYNGHKQSGKEVVKAVSIAANLNLEPQLMTFCDAIINTTDYEQKFKSDNLPHNLSYSVTPVLGRANSSTRTAATAQSIRLHKWRHQNEDVSADYIPRREDNIQVATNKSQASVSASSRKLQDSKNLDSNEENISDLFYADKLTKESPNTPKKILKTSKLTLKSITSSNLHKLPSLPKNYLKSKRANKKSADNTDVKKTAFTLPPSSGGDLSSDSSEDLDDVAIEMTSLQVDSDEKSSGKRNDDVISKPSKRPDSIQISRDSNQLMTSQPASDGSDENDLLIKKLSVDDVDVMTSSPILRHAKVEKLLYADDDDDDICKSRTTIL